MQGILDLDLLQQIYVLCDSALNLLYKLMLVFAQRGLGDLVREILRHELERAVDEVAEVVAQLCVHLESEIVPGEIAVSGLGAVCEEIIAPQLIE